MESDRSGFSSTSTGQAFYGLAAITSKRMRKLFGRSTCFGVCMECPHFLHVLYIVKLFFGISLVCPKYYSTSSSHPMPFLFWWRFSLFFLFWTALERNVFAWPFKNYLLMQDGREEIMDDCFKVFEGDHAMILLKFLQNLHKLETFVQKSRSIDCASSRHSVLCLTVRETIVTSNLSNLVCSVISFSVWTAIFASTTYRRGVKFQL